MDKEIFDLALKIRQNVLDMTFNSGPNGGHLGGSLSCADILAVLYGSILKVDSHNPANPCRDRFILSKGHCSIAHYAVLAECGFLTREEMMSFEVSGGNYSTHELINIDKGIEVTSGSLGYGLSIGVGIALHAKRTEKQYKTYVLMGDGECNEGTVWEAAMAAARFKLNDLVVIVDVNGQSLDGFTTSIMPVFDMEKVWEGFGWHVIVVDGNDIKQLLECFSLLSQEKPNVIIANTKKGKGIASIEGKVGWHHARLTEEQYKAFSSELNGGDK